MLIDFRTTARRSIMHSLFFLPRERRVRAERWLRGREDFRKLTLADCAVVSFGKSGRTWLRVMLSRVYQLRYGLARRHLLAFDNLHEKNSGIPRILFTHDNYLKDYHPTGNPRSHYHDKKTILMIRNPADIAVSQYYQWKFRMTDRKKLINDYPAADQDVSLYDFVMMPDCGLPKIIDFMNSWGREIPHIRQLLMIRYEDLRAQPGEMLRRVLEFIGTPASPDEIEQAVQFASVDNMRKLEQSRVFWLAGRRMLARDRSNINTYKVRRAKVGGYRDDFTPDQLASIEALMQSRLLPMFGYAPVNEAGGVAAG